MSWMTPVLPWYVAVQLCALAALPLSARFFRNLPDRGYAFAKVLGPFLVGVTLWLGTSYGLLRNEFGGAWIALGVVALLSFAFGGYGSAVEIWQETTPVLDRRAAGRGRRRYILAVEALFLAAFGVWAWVRAHDPAANHTEQPMDLMFMSSIWTSPTFPPRDAWLAGYPIGYYYLGYWLLTTLGHLSSTPPSIGYNVGQASWYGLLIVSSFGLGFNVLLSGKGRRAEPTAIVGSGGDAESGFAAAIGAGALTALFVGVIGNLQIVLEWLYAMGANLSRIAAWVDVNGFPENARQSGNWYIGYDWWWWRSSRVLSDQDLLGGHIEVIDEFPMFSYVLGDNHPHVLAMPVVIVVIGMALSVFLGAQTGAQPPAPGGLPAGRLAASWNRLLAAMPMGVAGLALVAVVSGGLVFLNTWDYPPYWLLLTGALFVGLCRGAGLPLREALGGAAITSTIFGGLLIAITLLFYLPYFLTAQSQARGLTPNLFNPSRLQQVVLMFGVFLPAVAGLIVWAWSAARPGLAALGWSAAVVLGVPAALLALSIALAGGTDWGRARLAGIALPGPEGSSATGHLPFMLERWMVRPYTFLLFGAALAACVAILWAALARPEGSRAQGAPGRALSDGSVFVVMVAATGLFLIFVPEFVFLDDNFGTRMNTVFKFYYQAWLLLAAAAAYVVAGALFARGSAAPVAVRVLSAVTLVAAVAALLYPFAGAYSKTMGFSAQAPSLDATGYVAGENPAEHAAVGWVLANTNADDVVLEGKGASYRANTNRVSAMTGRATLLGWDGHEAQWRGQAYGEMAGGRPEVLAQIYSTARVDEIPGLLEEWDIEYVYVGPAERSQYEMSPRAEERLMEAMDLVFDGNGVRIYRRR